MSRIFRMALLLGLVSGLLAQSAQAGGNPRGWYFPIPFTMNSPQNPNRWGGVEFSYGNSESGQFIGFPLISNLTDRKNTFIVEMSLPLSENINSDGTGRFFISSPRLGLRGTWEFDMPFAEGNRLPAAWSVGADLTIPLIYLWATSNRTLRAIAMYPYDPAAWGYGWGFRPKAQLAIGKPLFFAEFELSLPSLTKSSSAYAFLLGWGVTLGTMPHDVVSITLEFGGMHDLVNEILQMTSADPIWGALGFRFYIGNFVTGVAARLPFTQAYTYGSAGNEVSADPSVAILLFVGYEIRHAKRF